MDGWMIQRAAWKAGHAAECAALKHVHQHGRRLPPSLRLTLRILIHRHRTAQVAPLPPSPCLFNRPSRACGTHEGGGGGWETGAWCRRRRWTILS